MTTPALESFVESSLSVMVLFSTLVLPLEVLYSLIAQLPVRETFRCKVPATAAISTRATAIINARSIHNVTDRIFCFQQGQFSVEAQYLVVWRLHHAVWFWLPSRYDLRMGLAPEHVLHETRRRTQSGVFGLQHAARSGSVAADL